MTAALLGPGEVVWGMQLPIQAQSSLFVEPWEADAGPEELVAVSRAADRAGCFYLAVCDHVAIPRRLVEAMGATWYDTMTTLGFVAAVTERARLLTHVLVLPHRHPLEAAKAIATLDRLSGGRAIAGVGAGHVPEEFDLLGSDYERRGRVLDEKIPALAAALEEDYPALNDARFGLDGTWTVGPRPVRRPRPPIWVGGSTPAAIRRAGRLGDGWLPQGTPRRHMPEQIALLRQVREEAGGGPIDIGAITEWLYVGTPSWEVRRPCVAGSPTELAESLGELVAMGVGHLQVRFPSRSVTELVEQIEAFGTEVAPLLATVTA
jgi:probable F420-dependent oxidoreductase